MLIQRRADGLRLFTQHDHAIVSGQMALNWSRGPSGGDGRLRPDLVQAVGLHDFAWHSVDQRPRLNSATGRPHDFLDYPVADRLVVYRAGLDALEAIHPFAAHLVSRHYCAFAGMEAHEAFQSAEQTRRARLAAMLGERLGSSTRADGDLWLLQFFDLLSLYLCLAPPSAEREGLPDWLTPRSCPDGTPLRITWRDESEVAFEPSPWRGELRLSIPYRDLPARRFSDEPGLRDGYANAEPRRWTLRLT